MARADQGNHWGVESEPRLSADATPRTPAPPTRPPPSAPPGPQASTAEAPTGPPPRGRIRGIDAARAIAILGMVMVHFGPTDESGVVGTVYGAAHGRAAILFGLLAGVGVALLAGRRSPERLRNLYLKLGFRGAVLLPLGLALQMLPSGIAVILQFYAIYFLVAALVVHLSDRWLLGGAGIVLVVGPVIVLAAEIYRPSWFDSAPATFADWSEPLFVLRELFLTGNYPVVVWSALVLFGVWLGRRDLRSSSVRSRMLVGGTLAFAGGLLTEEILMLWVWVPENGAGWGWLAVAWPHSQMPLWLIQATGAATAVLAVCLFLSDRLPRASWPAVATGQLAFTVYVAQILLLGYYPEWFFRDTVGDAILTVGRFMLVAVVLAVAWRAVLPRGPLELVMNLPWERRRL